MYAAPNEELIKHIGHVLRLELWTPAQYPGIYCETCLTLLYCPNEPSQEGK